MKEIFYFEIPMNEGEYCLGCVDRGTGCYLLYLDIGANATKTQHTIVSERFTYTEETLTYPVGVSFLPYSSSGIDDNDSVAMTIPTGFAGKTLTVSRVGNAIMIVENSAATLSGDLKYLGENITIAANIKEKLKPKSTITKDTKRVQYLDYNVSMDQMVQTIITDVTTVEKDETGAATSNVTERTIGRFDQNGAAIAEAKWKIFCTSNGVSYDILALREMPINGATASGGIG